MPFDLERVEQLQPRLKNARKLLEAGGVRVLTDSAGETDVEVAGTDVMHTVRLRTAGDKCTCPWYSKYQGQRGPCKHILAAHLLVDGDEEGEGDGEL